MTQIFKLSRYIDLKNDVAFKRVFGRDKQMTLGLINAIIKDHQIVEIKDIRIPKNEKYEDLDFLNKEIINPITSRTIVLDLICTTDKGETIIIEMQRVGYKDFHARALLYTTLELINQHKLGDNDYKVIPVYFIGLLNFKLTKDEDYINEYTLYNKITGNVYPEDPLHIIFIEFPKFRLDENDCKDRLERIIYSFKHTPELKNIPKSFEKDDYLQKIFTFAEAEQFTPEEKRAYIESIMGEKRVSVLIESALRHGHQDGYDEGREKGRLDGILQTAKNMLSAGSPVEFIIQCTGLTEEQVLALQNR